MLNGSVTSIGVGYSSTEPIEGLPLRLATLLGTVLLPVEGDRYPLDLVGRSAKEPWIQTALRSSGSPRTNEVMLQRMFGAAYAELRTLVDLDGLGRLPATLRPFPTYHGALLDLEESRLFPDSTPERGARVVAALKDLLRRWHAQSPFSVAFVDHEAEFEGELERLNPPECPYAIAALPATPGSPGALEWLAGGWSLSPHGAS